ncbi:Rrf2 family transcriptional regulator [Candidatus Roizmanbacteria bacterium]|nr:Rrf2 family transcriptional regulator [Candidatus Roizmanbacteria bacterium]
MLTITNQSDYGILFLSYLLDKKYYVPLSELIKNTNLPKRFIARISAALAKHNIVKSKEGKFGGYQLTADLKKISLFEYLRIFEHDIALTKCVDASFNCPYDSICLHKNYLRHKLNRIVVKELKKTYLSEVVNG